MFDGPDEKLFASLGPTAHPSMGDGYRYRYLLGRRWNDNGTLLFIGLNPSVATHLILDPTLSRVMGYAGRERCGGFEVCNLFGWRETKPSLLPELSVAVGVGNDARILAAAARASVILLGWGSHSKGRRRAKDVLELLAPFSEKLHYLKLTKTEQPQHPLYIKKMEPFRRWSERASDPDAPHPNAAKDGGE